jgi:hypothetical protein
MCNCDIGDAPSAFRRETRTARKAHRCIECGRAISVGQRYEYASGVWDGRPDSFRTCSRCVVLREAHVRAEEQLQVAEVADRQRSWVEPCRPIIGGLIEAIGECAHDDPRYVRFFRMARRAIAPAMALVLGFLVACDQPPTLHLDTERPFACGHLVAQAVACEADTDCWAMARARATPVARRLYDLLLSCVAEQCPNGDGGDLDASVSCDWGARSEGGPCANRESDCKRDHSNVPE